MMLQHNFLLGAKRKEPDGFSVGLLKRFVQTFRETGFHPGPRQSYTVIVVNFPAHT
jgi:hypothetical protein